MLGSLARSAGTPVSLHGTGGAWMVVSSRAEVGELRDAVTRSLDRKVCNTLNTCCVVDPAGGFHAARGCRPGRAGGGWQCRGQPFKLHVARGSEHLVSQELFSKRIEVRPSFRRGARTQAEVIDRPTAWHEGGNGRKRREVSLVSVDSVDEAVRMFNELSPRLVGTLVSSDRRRAGQLLCQTRCPLCRRWAHPLGRRSVRPEQAGTRPFQLAKRAALWSRRGAYRRQRLHCPHRYRSTR